MTSHDQTHIPAPARVCRLSACLPLAAFGLALAVATPAPAQAPAAPATPAPLPPAAPASKAAEQAQKEGEDDMALVQACKAHALAVLKGRSPSIDDIFIDMDGLTVAKANLAVEDTKVEAVLMGEAYIQRDRSDKVHRFLCLAGADGKVLMTFFTLR